MIERIGAIGDIHAEDEALFAVLQFLRTQRLDAILSVGDIVDGDGDGDRCCALLRDNAVHAVRGNHERWLGEGRPWDPRSLELDESHRRWLASLPPTRRFDTPLGPLLLCHAIGEDDMSVLRSDTDAHSLRWLTALIALQRDPEVALMLAGHTHERMVRRFEGLTVINAGTLHRDDAPGFLVVDFTVPEVRGFDVEDGRIREAERYPL